MEMILAKKRVTISIAKIRLNESFIVFSLNNHRKVSLAFFSLFVLGSISSLMIITLEEAYLGINDGLSFSNHVMI
jgi:hypothetical protein